MNVWRNRAVVMLGALDKPIRGRPWRPLVRRLYHWMAGFYDAAIVTYFSGYQRMTQALVVEAGVTPRDRVLDLGCGTGMVTLPAAAIADSVFGVDLSDAMLVKLQQKCADMPDRRPHLVQADALQLPLAETTFDVILTSFMLPHLSDDEIQQLFVDAAKLLDRGGRFAALTGMDAITDVYPSRAEWQAWLQRAGFRDIAITEHAGAYRMVTASLAWEE